LRKRGAGSKREDAPNQYYPIYYLEKDNSISTEYIDAAIAIIPRLSDGTDGRWRWAKNTVEGNKNKLLARKVRRNNNYEYDIFEKSYFSEDKIEKVRSIFYEKEINFENATEELKNLFNSKLFDYPKPVHTIAKFINLFKGKDDLILDFFAGSGTTAQAVMELNKEDSGSRKFICVQLPEKTEENSEAFKAGYKTIAEISKERIRRAAKKIETEVKEQLSDLPLQRRTRERTSGFRF
jgi:adenine-specific DNA-methyltransferase